MHGLQLSKHLRPGWHAAHLMRRHRSRSRQERHRRVRQRAPRLRIHALQPQQPVLEVSRQRLDRCAGGQRIEHRGPETIQPLVGVGVLRPLVEQLGEVAHVAQRVRRVSARRPPSGDRTRLRVVQPHQLPPLFLEVRHLHFGERLERTREARPRPAGAFGDAALLPPVARQEDDDPVGLTELVGAKNQCVGGVQRHEPVYFTAFSCPVLASGTARTPWPAPETRETRTRRSSW